MWYECVTCQDGRTVLDLDSYQMVSCPECCADAQPHDCADHAAPAADQPAFDGSRMTWTECQVCGFILDKPQLASC